MRLTSEFVVSALIRRVFLQGGGAAVLRRGAQAAGAIFIRNRARTGLETLYGPAPQTVFSDEMPGDRQFEVRLADAEAEAVEALLAREIRFDADCWIVEIETDVIGDLFAVVLPDGKG